MASVLVNQKLNVRSLSFSISLSSKSFFHTLSTFLTFYLSVEECATVYNLLLFKFLGDGGPVQVTFIVSLISV